LLDLRERVPKASAGSWFQSWVVIFTKEYFPISVWDQGAEEKILKMRNAYRILA
jgi:hypothetical protein